MADRRRRIAYPTGRLLGVVDRPGDAPRIVTALAEAEIGGEDVEVLLGREAIAVLEPRTALGRALARTTRAVQFTTMDQMPDFLLYEAALRDGKAVLAVRTRTDARRRVAITALTDGGAHFLNFFGRFSTEEISLWRGTEPDLPGLLRR